MKAKILTLIFCFATLLAYAENENNAFNASYKYSKKRTIDANFETIVGTSVALIGKYSDYKISSWEENYVSFHVEIIAKANKEEYAEEKKKAEIKAEIERLQKEIAEKNK